MIKHVPHFVIAALFAALIGALVYVSMDLSECAGYGTAFDECRGRVLHKLQRLSVVFIGAGIGGALSARFFGWGKKRSWDKIWRTVIGAFLSTLWGGVIVGAYVGIMAGLSFGELIAGSAIGGIAGFYASFSTWSSALIWIVGFALLELTMRKRRQYDL